MTKPADTRSIVVEREMPHPPQKIVGHRFTFRATPMAHWNGVTDCEVLVVEPNKRLSYPIGGTLLVMRPRED